MRCPCCSPRHHRCPLPHHPLPRHSGLPPLAQMMRRQGHMSCLCPWQHHLQSQGGGRNCMHTSGVPLTWSASVTQCIWHAGRYCYTGTACIASGACIHMCIHMCNQHCAPCPPAPLLLASQPGTRLLSVSTYCCMAASWLRSPSLLQASLVEQQRRSVCWHGSHGQLQQRHELPPHPMQAGPFTAHGMQKARSICEHCVAQCLGAIWSTA